MFLKKKKKRNTRLQVFKTTNVHMSKSQYLDILQQIVFWSLLS